MGYKFKERKVGDTPNLDALLSQSTTCEPRVFIPLRNDTLLSRIGNWLLIPQGKLPHVSNYQVVPEADLHRVFVTLGCDFLEVLSRGEVRVVRYPEYLVGCIEAAVGSLALDTFFRLVHNGEIIYED